MIQIGSAEWFRSQGSRSWWTELLHWSGPGRPYDLRADTDTCSGGSLQRRLFTLHAFECHLQLLLEKTQTTTKKHKTFSCYLKQGVPSAQSSQKQLDARRCSGEWVGAVVSRCHRRPRRLCFGTVSAMRWSPRARWVVYIQGERVSKDPQTLKLPSAEDKY